MTTNFERFDKSELERMLLSTKEKFENYTALQKPFDEINEVYTSLKKLQEEFNKRTMGRYS